MNKASITMFQKLNIMFVCCALLTNCDKDPVNPGNEIPAMKLIFTRGSEILLYDMLNEELEVLIKEEEVVYVTESGNTWTRGYADRAKWSPDGKSIAFLEVLFVDGGTNLKLINLNTREETTFNGYPWRFDYTPEWANNKKIIFSKSIDVIGFGSWRKIFTININSEKEKQITKRLNTNDHSPTIHHNGIDILFLSVGGMYHTTMREDQVLLITQSRNGPQFNPKTSEVIFWQKDDDGSANIWKVPNMDFKNPIQLTNSKHSDLNISWSNDGKYIVFSRYKGGPYTNTEIWMMNADGTEQRKILEDGTSPNLWIN